MRPKRTWKRSHLKDDGWIFFGSRCLLLLQEQDAGGQADGNPETVSTWCCFLPCLDTAGLTWTCAMSPFCSVAGEETLECHILLKGYWLSVYCSIKCSAMPDMKTTENILYCSLIPFEKKNCASQNVLRNLWVLLNYFCFLFKERGLSK